MRVQAGHPADRADVAVAVHGFVGANDRAAKATYLEHELRMFTAGPAEIGRPGLAANGRASDLDTGRDGVRRRPQRDRRPHPPPPPAARHSRQILQMDVGGMPQAAFLESIELLGTEVLPQTRKELEQP